MLTIYFLNFIHALFMMHEIFQNIRVSGTIQASEKSKGENNLAGIHSLKFVFIYYLPIDMNVS